MATTIQISEQLQEELARRKLFERETYEEIIWDVLEDVKELNEETKRDIAEAREDIAKGRYHKLSAVKKDLGF